MKSVFSRQDSIPGIGGKRNKDMKLFGAPVPNVLKGKVSDALGKKRIIGGK